MMRASLFGSAAAVGVALLATASAYSADKQGAEAAKSGAPAARLITEAQYVNTLGVVFGPGLRFSPKFAPIPRVDGLVAVGSSAATMTSGAFDQFDGVARVVAEQVTSPQNR